MITVTCDVCGKECICDQPTGGPGGEVEYLPEGWRQIRMEKPMNLWHEHEVCSKECEAVALKKIDEGTA